MRIADLDINGFEKGDRGDMDQLHKKQKDFEIPTNSVMMGQS